MGSRQTSNRLLVSLGNLGCKGNSKPKAVMDGAPSRPCLSAPILPGITFTFLKMEIPFWALEHFRSILSSVFFYYNWMSLGAPILLSGLLAQSSAFPLPSIQQMGKQAALQVITGLLEKE